MLNLACWSAEKRGTMLRKIAAVLVMILSTIGCLVCLGVLVGAWLANEPATDAVTGSLAMVDGYLDLAAQTTGQLDSNLEVVHGKVEELSTAAPDQIAQLRETVAQEVTPRLTQVKSAVTTLRSGIVTVNEAVEQLNRLPGADVPTLSDELQSIDQRVETIKGELETITSTQEIDGTRLVAAADKVSQEIEAARTSLDEWSTRITDMRATIASATATIPGLFDKVTWTLTLFSLLFGAGQVSLFMYALHWFRTPPLPTSTLPA